jgi:ParB family transcriptional regulator, chromosome partitioning protein
MTNNHIEEIAIADLTPYARNSRTHTPQQISQIAASIAEFGFTNPVLIDSQGGIIAGHGRVLAAEELGIEEVPCIRLTHLSEDQKRAYIIADNKLALNAGWDESILAMEIGDLKNLGFDLDLLGFSVDELNGMKDILPLDAMPNIPNGDREPFQQITFTLHDDQAEQVKAAINAAKAMGGFVETENENSNGNALSRICETYLTMAENA